MEYVAAYKSGVASGSIQKRKVQLIDDHKVCNTCHINKPLCEFPTRNTMHGYRHECKTCETEHMSKYYTDVYNKKRRERKKNDPEFRLLCNHRLYVYKNLTSQGLKSKSSLKYLQCTLSTLKTWLESQFHSGMSWSNYGSFWTVDHVLPLNAFNLLNEKDQLIAFNWKNLRPSLDNFSKSTKLRFHEYFESIILAHRFIQKHELPSNEYQSINESRCWLREKLRHGQNLTDEEVIHVIISRNGQSAAKLLTSQ